MKHLPKFPGSVPSAKFADKPIHFAPVLAEVAQLEKNEVYSRLKTRPKGLSEETAPSRLAEVGPNVVAEGKHRDWPWRLSPAHKQRIIRSLQHRGHVVGFMGDGINDAPVLHIADVGIPVDSAVDIAKAAAALILLEKDLMVLDYGVVEGRKVFVNIPKYVRMLGPRPRLGVELLHGHVEHCVIGHGTDGDAHLKSRLMSREELLAELRTALTRFLR